MFPMNFHRLLQISWQKTAQVTNTPRTVCHPLLCLRIFIVDFIHPTQMNKWEVFLIGHLVIHIARLATEGKAEMPLLRA